MEELSFKLRLEIEQTPDDKTTDNPHRLAVFKRLFADVGVEGDGRSGPYLDRMPNNGSDPSLDKFVKKSKALLHSTTNRTQS